MTSICYGARDFYDAQKVLNNPAAKERFLNMCSDGIYQGWPVSYLINECWTEWQEAMDLVIQIHEELDTVDIDLIRDMLPEKFQRENFDFHDRLLYICDQTWPTWIKNLMDTMNANAITEEEFVAQCEELERQEAKQAMIEATGFDPDNAVESLDNMFSDEGPEETSNPKGFTEWVDSKFEPMKRDNPVLYWGLFFPLLSPIMIPIAILEGLFTSSPKKRQWYQEDDQGNWIPVVIDEVTGEVTPGEGLS